MTKAVFTTPEFILYLLQKIEPEDATKLKLNKIAFFTEFGYIYRQQKSQLSDAEYAAINYGPVINNYRQILEEMEKAGQVKLENNHVRPLVSPQTKISEEVAAAINELIEKYSKFNTQELIGLSHSTDSYKITTNNEKTMGQIIDKDLALLETFFDESANEEILTQEAELPKVKQSDLIEYGV